MNTTETDLIFERYTQTKILSEDMNDGYAPEDESVGDFDEFIGKAEKFADALGDAELKFLHTLRDDQFPVLMDFIKDEVGYRDQIPAEDYES